LCPGFRTTTRPDPLGTAGGEVDVRAEWVGDGRTGDDDDGVRWTGVDGAAVAEWDGVVAAGVVGATVTE
jgi:hypothetical protein